MGTLVRSPRRGSRSRGRPRRGSRWAGALRLAGRRWPAGSIEVVLWHGWTI